MVTVTALCGHPTCNPLQPRNSVLDEAGDVVLYRSCDGRQWLFRDGHPDGLLAAPTDDGWTLTRAVHTEVKPGQWDLVVAADPSCTVVRDGQTWTARTPGGRTVARRDTQWGALAATGRHYLRRH